jgi:hypothetical protein
MFLRAFVASAVLGSLVGLVILVAAGADFLSAAFITAASAGPAILGAAALAGRLARIGAQAQPPWRARDWSIRGASWGAAGGSVLLAAWNVAFNLPAGEPPMQVVALMGGIGAVAGAAVGCSVALYCASLSRARLAV